MIALRSALAVLDSIPTPEDSHRLVIAKCRGLMAGYAARWDSAAYQIFGAEQLITSDLWNPETSRKSRSFTVAGKLDARGEYAGRRVIFDHKSTSDDISDPNSPYWRQLIVEGQVNHYMLLEWLNGTKVDEAVWDVMRKPGISPKLLSKKDLEMVVMSKRYFGREISKDTAIALNHEPRETLEMYEARLAHDCTVNRPQWYFQRRTAIRLDADIHEYAIELWGHSQDILHARRENRWPRNSGACMLYGAPCKFLDICSGFDSPDSENWKRKAFVHPELPPMDGDGRDVLTNTRIRCFQTCRRKHFYEYELGIERTDEEEREALWFGTAWHLALEAYFNALKEQYDNSSSDSAGSELATVPADN